MKLNEFKKFKLETKIQKDKLPEWLSKLILEFDLNYEIVYQPEEYINVIKYRESKIKGFYIFYTSKPGVIEKVTHSGNKIKEIQYNLYTLKEIENILFDNILKFYALLYEDNKLIIYSPLKIKEDLEIAMYKK